MVTACIKYWSLEKWRPTIGTYKVVVRKSEGENPWKLMRRLRGKVGEVSE
jgi:pyruvate/oxaloacetate carboxyltransferase